MVRRSPGSTRTSTLLPSSTRFRSAGILAGREQDRGVLRGPVVGGKEGAIDAGDVPFGEVARGHRQFARGVEPAGRGGLFGAHRAERVAMIADRIALADREILVDRVQDRKSTRLNSSH